MARLRPQLLDLVRGRLTRRVAGKPLLAGLQKLLRPSVIEVLVEPFLAAELSNADLTAKAHGQKVGAQDHGRNKQR
jgi:hypothetical protein